MPYKKVCKTLLLLLTVSVNLSQCQEVSSLNDAQTRFARLRCLQQYPQAEIVNYSDTSETQCFLHCFLYKTGLMNLTTRGLSSKKFIDIWEKLEGPFAEDTCLERYDFDEHLSGKCSDTYRKLMEFRNKCFELFEYTFTANITWKTEDTKSSKKIGQSATEFCDHTGRQEDTLSTEHSQDNEVFFLPHYKDKLKCIFENIHYLDAYGRIDKNEINLSYQEALGNSCEPWPVVSKCAHRANSKYQQDYVGNSVLEMQNCLKSQSDAFDKVFRLRDETSRQY